MSRQETFVEKLVDIFIRNGIFKEDKAKAIKKIFYDRAKSSFVNFLLEEGLVSRGQILNALSEYYKVPAFDVVGYFFDYHQLHKFPKGVLLRNAMIPLEVDENMLIMIASEPDNEELLVKIGEYVSYDVRFMVGIALDITDAVSEFYDRAVTEVPPDIDIDQENRAQEAAENIILEDEDYFPTEEDEEEEKEKEEF
jgi:MshEN domain